MPAMACETVSNDVSTSNGSVTSAIAKSPGSNVILSKLGIERPTTFGGMISLSSSPSVLKSWSRTDRKVTAFGTTMVACNFNLQQLEALQISLQVYFRGDSWSMAKSSPIDNRYPHHLDTLTLDDPIFNGQIALPKMLLHDQPNLLQLTKFPPAIPDKVSPINTLQLQLDEKFALLSRMLPLFDSSNIEVSESDSKPEIYQQIHLERSSPLQSPSMLMDTELGGTSPLHVPRQQNHQSMEPPTSPSEDIGRGDNATTSNSIDTKTPSNSRDLLRKAKAKHQLSLARLRVQKQYRNKDVSTTDAPRSNTTTVGEIQVVDMALMSNSSEMSKDTVIRPTQQASMEKSTPSKSPETTILPATPTIDFSRFSKEQFVLFEPGSVGMQLEQSTSDYPAKIVRFVDGGPQDPGQARQSGRLRPGDFVVRVEAEGIVGTTYYTILHLLQKSWTIRKLTFRSAWEPANMGNSCTPIQKTTESTQRPTTRQATLNESTPVPYQWSPLPYDWISKRLPQPSTPDERKALEQTYHEEASRLVREREEQMRRAKEEQREERQLSLQQQRQTTLAWNFEDMVIGAVALTAESVASCLKKHPQYDDDSDEEVQQDNDHHPKRD